MSQWCLPVFLETVRMESDGEEGGRLTASDLGRGGRGRGKRGRGGSCCSFVACCRKSCTPTAFQNQFQISGKVWQPSVEPKTSVLTGGEWNYGCKELKDQNVSSEVILAANCGQISWAWFNPCIAKSLFFFNGSVGKKWEVALSRVCEVIQG